MSWTQLQRLVVQNDAPVHDYQRALRWALEAAKQRALETAAAQRESARLLALLRDAEAELALRQSLMQEMAVLLKQAGH